MKNLYAALVVIISIFACSNQLNAQVLFFEDFDGIAGPTAGGPGTYTFAPGFLLRNVDNRTPATNVNYVNEAWERREDFQNSVVDSVAFATSWYAPAGAANDWMWTPAITIPATGTIKLSWNAKNYDALYLDGYEVRVMVAPNTPTGGTAVIGNQITNSTVLYSNNAESAAWTAREVSLNTYRGQTIYIAYRLTSTDKFLLVIDDIKVERVVDYDASVTAITKSEYTQIPKKQASIALGGRIKNLGASALTNLRLKADVYDASNNIVYSQTSASYASIAAGADTGYVMTPWVPTQTGNFNIKYYPLATEADANAANDTLTSSFLITDTVYGRDNGIITGSLGIGAGNGGYLGQSFTINATTKLTSISAHFTRGYTGKQYSFALWNTDVNGKPTTIAATTDTLLYPDDSARLYTVRVKNNGYDLSVGKYVITAIEFDSTLALSQTTDIFKTGTTWVNWPTSPIAGGWGNNEAFGANFAKPYVIRMNVDDVMNIWTGIVNNSWNTAGNWSKTAVPVITDSVIIPSGTPNAPTISSLQSINHLNVASGVTVTLNGALQVSGNITNNGTFIGTDTLFLNGTNTQSINGIGSITNLTLNNSVGVNVIDTLKITKTFTPTRGTLTTNNKLVFKSNSLGTARIASGAGAIIGGVNVERYIAGGKRAFRFMGHPFSNATSLSQFSDDVDITGSGGASNGFTTTGTNAASAFYYDATQGNGSTSSDPGWKPYTTTATTIASGAGFRLLVRGAKGQSGIFTLPYATPTATTIKVNGELNASGNYVKELVKGSNSGYNFISNPYVSPVNLRTLSKTAGVNNNFYIWNARLGTSGGYLTYTFGANDYALPTMGSFIVNTTASFESITFKESDKVVTDTATMLRQTPIKGLLEMSVNLNGAMWDRFALYLNGKSKPSYDEILDAVKFRNADVNVYSLSKEGKALAVDVRPYDETAIPLGFTSTMQKKFSFNVDNINFGVNEELFLKDNYTNTLTLLQAGTSYDFVVDANAASQGDMRFELVAKNIKPSSLVLNNEVEVYPNPTTSILIVKRSGLNEKEKTVINIIDATGKVVKTINAGKQSSINQTINTKTFVNGVYVIEVVNGKEKHSQNIIKQ